MQTPLDTNVQLDPQTRHAWGLPAHYECLAIKYTAVRLGCERGAAGGGAGMAVVVTCVCISRCTSNNGGGHVQVGGWGRFSNVLHSLLKGECRRCHLHLKTCSRSHIR